MKITVISLAHMFTDQMLSFIVYLSFYLSIFLKQTIISHRKTLNTKIPRQMTFKIKVLFCSIIIFYIQEKFEDTKGVIRSRKSKKYRQHNGK